MPSCTSFHDCRPCSLLGLELWATCCGEQLEVATSWVHWPRCNYQRPPVGSSSHKPHVQRCGLQQTCTCCADHIAIEGSLCGSGLLLAEALCGSLALPSFGTSSRPQRSCYLMSIRRHRPLLTSCQVPALPEVFFHARPHPAGSACRGFGRGLALSNMVARFIGAQRHHRQTQVA